MYRKTCVPHRNKSAKDDDLTMALTEKVKMKMKKVVVSVCEI